MVSWQGREYTVDNRDPVTGEDFYRLGEYLNRHGSKSEAAHFLELGARYGHVGAQELYGYVLFLMDEWAAALPWLQRFMSATSTYFLGLIHYRGCPAARVGVDYDRAAGLFRQAVEFGLPEARIMLSEMYLERLLPLRVSPVEHALEMLLPAADAGHPYAQFRAAEAYAGVNHPQWQQFAARYYELCRNNPATLTHPLHGVMMNNSWNFLSNYRYHLELQQRDAQRRGQNPPGSGSHIPPI